WPHWKPTDPAHTTGAASRRFGWPSPDGFGIVLHARPEQDHQLFVEFHRRRFNVRHQAVLENQPIPVHALARVRADPQHRRLPWLGWLRGIAQREWSMILDGIRAPATRFRAVNR